VFFFNGILRYFEVLIAVKIHISVFIVKFEAVCCFKTLVPI